MPLVSPEVRPAVEDIPSVPGYDHYVVLALPPHMGQALPVVHRLLLPPHGIFLDEGAYAISKWLFTFRGRGVARGLATISLFS